MHSLPPHTRVRTRDAPGGGGDGGGGLGLATDLGGMHAVFPRTRALARVRGEEGENRNSALSVGAATAIDRRAGVHVVWTLSALQSAKNARYRSISASSLLPS